MQELIEDLLTATRANLIKWQPLGEGIETEFGVKCEYETEFACVKFQTIIKSYQDQKGFLNLFKPATILAYGLSIKKGDKSITLTDNPKIIDGWEWKHNDLFTFCFAIQCIAESSVDLLNRLEKSLDSLLKS